MTPHGHGGSAPCPRFYPAQQKTHIFPHFPQKKLAVRRAYYYIDKCRNHTVLYAVSGGRYMHRSYIYITDKAFSSLTQQESVMEDITRALLVMDGGYVRTWYKHLAGDGIEGNFYSINFGHLIRHIGALIEKDSGRRCVFTAKKLYMGTNSEIDFQNRTFYRSLDDAGVQRHTFPLRERDEESGYPALKEEACDTTIVYNTAKEFFSAGTDNRFDMFVLFAGDGDLTPLVQGLRAEGVTVTVVYYDFKTPFSTTRASQKLLESADKVINFGAFLTERVDRNIIDIFRKLEEPEVYAVRRPTVRVAAKRFPGSAAATARTFPAPVYALYTPGEIAEAIREIPRKDGEGYVLVAQLGTYLEHKTGKVLPFGIKLKDILTRHAQDFETKELPAYSVRLTESRIPSEQEGVPDD